MKVPDVPSQYKALVEKQTLALVDAATPLWAVVRELGESFECEGDGFRITLKVDKKPSKDPFDKKICPECKRKTFNIKTEHGSSWRCNHCNYVFIEYLDMTGGFPSNAQEGPN